MWVLTSADRRALYNLSYFEVIAAERDGTSGKWVVEAMRANGDNRILLAAADDQEAAENLIAAIAESAGAMDLGRE